MSRTALVAIGGQSLITDMDHPVIPNQWAAGCETHNLPAGIIEDSGEPFITYGNTLLTVNHNLRRSEIAAGVVHGSYLDPIVSGTEDVVGALLQQARSKNRANIGRTLRLKTGTWLRPAWV